MPAHIWEITHQGPYLVIRTRWEGEKTSANFPARAVPGEAAFELDDTQRLYRAVLVDKQHFVIGGWCTGTEKGWDGESPTYDVIFSRPGIAELTGRSVYQKNRDKVIQPRPRR